MTALLGQRDARRDGGRLGISARARLYGGGESADHPGLVSLPGSASLLEPPGVVFSSDREPCRRALSPDSGRGGISNSLRSELAGDPAQDFTNRHPTLGFGRLRHGPHHEGSHEQEVVKACRGFGNVCRVRA